MLYVLILKIKWKYIFLFEKEVGCSGGAASADIKNLKLVGLGTVWEETY